MQYTPNPISSSSSGVSVLYEYPPEEYRNLGVIDFDYYRPGLREPTVTDALPKLKQKVREAGGNALIVRNQKVGQNNSRYITISAEVLSIDRSSGQR